MLGITGVASWAIVDAFPSLGGPSWVNRVPDAGVVVYLVGVGLAAIWLLWRSWRTGVRFDAKGITVRNFWSTRRIAFTEVSYLADAAYHGPNGSLWALRVMLRDGRSVKAWCLTDAGRQPKPATLDLLRQTAARYGIDAELTGQISLRPGARRRKSTCGAVMVLFAAGY
jgi:hypothetical protein